MARDPYELIGSIDKTTITAPGGVTLGYGPGPGLRNAIFWNRIGSLFSCYRPAVAALSLFAADDPHRPVPLKTVRTRWRPNHVRAEYRAPGIRIVEDRYATRAGLVLRLTLQTTRKRQTEWLLCFHGQVEQWPFFDYQASDAMGRALAAPEVSCRIDRASRSTTLTQPHPYSGMPVPVNSIQTVRFSRALAAFGFGQDESDLHALWHDHGCLESLRMRLGQVGGRLVGAGPSARPAGAKHGRGRARGSSPTVQPPTFSHRHPLYYATLRIKLTPGKAEHIIVRSDFHTDDPGGKLAEPPARLSSRQVDAELKRSERQWRRYLREEVPQLACDDEALTRYWYYVWYVLKANRTAPGRHVTHPFTAPSKYLYWGPWIWDGYFHVLGEMWLQDPEVAKDSIRAVLDMQFPNGFIPVCSGSQYRMCFHEDIPGYRSPAGGGYASYLPHNLKGYRELEHPFEAEVDVGAAFMPPAGDQKPGRMNATPTTIVHNEKTQTPLITCAAVEYASVHEDRAFAREVAPKLLEYDDWLWRRRTDKQGRFILWHGDESGWDNATRHYPVPAKPFDVQLHAFMHRKSLADLLGTSSSRAIIDSRLWQTWEAISTYWDKNDRWYYDFGARGDGQRTGKRRKQICASGLFALWGIHSERVTKACLFALNHAKVFAAPYPIPTLARCDPDYAPHGWGWNGPVWLQVNYLVITGLLGNHQYDAAFKLWEQTKRLIMRDGRPHSFELYDPETGTGMGCPDYSWQAMINHLIIRHFAGVHSFLLQPALPPGLKRLKLSNLAGRISAVKLERKGKRVKITAKCAQPTVLRMRTAGLGEVLRVTGNGEKFARTQQDLWELPRETQPSRPWEIIVTCR